MVSAKRNDPKQMLSRGGHQCDPLPRLALERRGLIDIDHVFDKAGDHWGNPLLAVNFPTVLLQTPTSVIAMGGDSI